MKPLISVILNVASSIVFFLLGVSIDRAGTWVRLRHLRNVWKPFLSKKTTYIVLSTRPGPHPRSTPRVSLNEVRAYAAIREVLSSLKVLPNPIDSDARMQDLSDANLVVLGGPAANAVAGELWRRLSPKLPFTFDMNRLSLKVADREYVPKESTSGALERDYALLVRVASPLDSRRAALMCLGCHGYGTLGAARVLTDVSLAKQMLRMTGNKGFSAALLGFDLDKGNITNTEWLECYELGRLD